MEDDPWRGSGTTTRQLKDAADGALFIAVNSSALDYTKSLARHLGRMDLWIYPPTALENQSLRGRDYPEIVLDHAVQLTERQRSCLVQYQAWIEARNKK